MIYQLEIKPSCQNEMRKFCRKNALLQKILESKMQEILLSPEHYKPLKYDLAGERRVHIMKSFVLKFECDNIKKIVTFTFFGHHDEAYR